MTGIPLLFEMLTYKRPAGTWAEEAFIRRFIIPTGAKPDEMGNYILQVGTSRVAWLSHTDTVHYNAGRQRLRVRSGVVTVRHPKRSPQKWRECLGADDTTGVWLMLEMIRASVPGRYIFHYGEEKGCLGSTHIANHTPEVLAGIDYAISLDRRGEDSIVTHQCGTRTASDLFAWSLADALKLPGLSPDPTGVFTDSEAYAHIIPECTNVSVGYLDQHSSIESQDLGWAGKLRDRLTAFDESKLLRERDPARYYVYAGDDTLLPAGWEWMDDYDPDPEIECPLCASMVPEGLTWPFAGGEVCGPCFEAITS